MTGMCTFITARCSATPGCKGVYEWTTAAQIHRCAGLNNLGTEGSVDTSIFDGIPASTEAGTKTTVRKVWGANVQTSKG